MSSINEVTSPDWVDSSEAVKFGRKLFESMETGIAILNAKTLTPILINQRFGNWFPVPDGQSQHLQLGKIDLPDLAGQLELGQYRDFDLEVKAKRRSLAIRVRASLEAFKGARFLLLEAQNVSKLKELEYMMESYSKMLERNERQLRREKERAEKLLLNVMPKQIFDEVKAIGVTSPQRYDQCTVLMLDFVGFTEMSVSQDPAALISELNDIFTAFDRIVEQFGCERIKTIGDAYMAVSGLPEPAPDHAANIARVALRIIRYLERRNIGNKNQWRCRIGIHSGPVVGSIIGTQKFVYDIFGPGVNMAARLEALSAPMQVTLSEAMVDLLEGEFLLEEHGEVEIKGFGKHWLFLLRGEKAVHY